jgi:hypothetical protein
MRLAARRHTEMSRELAAFRVAVSSAMEWVLGRLPNNTTKTEMVGELAAEFQKVLGCRSKHK